MNVLMIGGANKLMNQLIRKIKKEGHRIYLLTGSRYTTDTYEKVFERYDLNYSSEHLSDVFESVSPDVTIFMGAFDSNFRWANEERELVRLTSSLTNLLTSHTMGGKGRFIFLSSEERKINRPLFVMAWEVSKLVRLDVRLTSSRSSLVQRKLLSKAPMKTVTSGLTLSNTSRRCSLLYVRSYRSNTFS